MTSSSDRAEILEDRRIAPSILSADFYRLGAQIEEVMDAGARVIHVDVMDGQFVPPITIGPMIVSAIADQVHERGGFVDVHMMIADPENQVADFASAGADSITFHVEATPHAHRLAGAIRDAGCLAGAALNPGTAVEAVAEIVEEVDILLCMTVNPGWGGQQFIESSPSKVSRLAGISGGGSESDRPVIEVDGGIGVETASPVVDAGAGLLVAGSAVFGASDPAGAYRAIAEVAGAA